MLSFEQDLSKYCLLMTLVSGEKMHINTETKNNYLHYFCSWDKVYAAMCGDIPSLNRKTPTNESQFVKGYQPHLFSLLFCYFD